MNRTHWILCGLLAVQMLLLLVVSQPFADHGSAETRTLLPDVDLADVSRIEIRSGEGDSVSLSRDGEHWGLTEAGGYPADDEQIQEILETLSGLTVRRPVVTSARYHAALEVAEDDFQRRVRLWTDDDDPGVELLLGTSPNYRVIHVRRGGEDEVYEVRDLSAYDLRAEASAWVAKRFVDVPVDDVVSVKLTNSAGTIEVERSEKDDETGESWKLVSPTKAPRALDPDAVRSMVDSVAQLWINDPAGPLDEAAQGLDAPVATVEIRYRERPTGEGADEAIEPAADAKPDVDAGSEPEAAADEQPDAEAAPEAEMRLLTVRLGAEAPDGEGKRYAARSGFAYAALLGSYDVEKIAEKQLDDLLVADDDGGD